MISTSTRALFALAAAAAFAAAPVLAQFSLATVANPAASDAPASYVATGAQQSLPSDLRAGIPVATTAATSLAPVSTGGAGDALLTILPIVPTSVPGVATPTTTPIAAPADAQSASGSGSPGPATRPSSSRPTSTSQPTASSNAVPSNVTRPTSSSPFVNGTALSSVAAAALGRGDLAVAVLALASVFAALA